MAKKSAAAPAPSAALASKSEEIEDKAMLNGMAQDEEESQEEEEIEIDPKKEKYLRSEGKIRDQVAGKWPAGYRECLGCGRGVHIKTKVCPLCDTEQPQKESSGPRAKAAPAPSVEDVFALVHATVAFSAEYESVDQAIDDVETVIKFVETCGGKARALDLLANYKASQK